MATTSDHSCPSSSPTKYSADPAGQVEELLAQAQIAVELDPRVERFVVENCNDFFTAFMRQVNLIKSRSQAFEDCHVTVFDKVLLELTQNGNNLKNAPAVRYFCEEFLGIPSNASGVQKTAMLAGAINASSLEDPGKASQLSLHELDLTGGHKMSVYQTTLEIPSLQAISATNL